MTTYGHVLVGVFLFHFITAVQRPNEFSNMYTEQKNACVLFYRMERSNVSPYHRNVHCSTYMYMYVVLNSFGFYCVTTYMYMCVDLLSGVIT